MPEFQAKIVVRDDLTFLGDRVELSEPTFYSGQTVYLTEAGVLPYNLIAWVIAAPLPEYLTIHSGATELTTMPRWVYLLQDPLTGHIPGETYIEDQLLAQETRLKLVEEGMEDMPLFKIIHEFYVHDLNIKKPHIIAMWDYLEYCGVFFNPCNLKGTAKIFSDEYFSREAI